MRIANFIQVVWIGLLFCVPAFGQAKYEYTAKDCVAFAKKNNPQVRSALIAIDIQRQVNRQITAAALPGVNASGNFTYNAKVPVQSFPNFISAATYGVLTQEGVKNGTGTAITAPSDFGFINAAFGSKYIASGGVQLDQLLFDGQVFVGLKARKTVIDLQTKVADLTEEIIDANIYKIYYQLVAGKTQIVLLDSNITRLEKLLRDTKIIYTNGFAEKVDVSKVTVQLTNLQTARLTALNTIGGGYLGLKLLIGMPMRDTLVLTEEITDEKLQSNMLSDTAYQYENRKEYQLLQLTKKLRDLNIQRYQYSGLPTLALNGGYTYTAQRNSFNFFSKNQPWFPAAYIGLQLNVPIFNGFRRQAQVQQARLERQQTLVSIDSAQLSIDREVAQARLDYTTAMASLDYQKSNVQLATEVYEQTKKKYEIGTGSQTEINASQSDLQQAQTNYVAALYDAITARIDYLKAVGRLNSL